MKPICSGTHPLIAFGSCPWCNATILDGKIADASSPIAAAIRWNAPALQHAVANGTREDAINVITNMLFHAGNLDVAFPVLKAGLIRNESDVSEFAQHALSRFGDGITAEQIDQFEKQLNQASTGDGFALRVLLLGAFFRRRETSQQWRQWRNEHILWLINNQPRAQVLASPYCHLSESEDEGAFVEARRKWIELIESNPDDLSILDNAAGFFHLNDPTYSESLYQKARELEPENPKWSEKLAHVSTLRNVHATGPDRVAKSRDTLADFQKALAQTTNEAHRLYLLPSVAKAALDAQDLEGAESAVAEYAKLTQRPEYSHIEDTGHELSLLQGRCTLRRGHIDAARALLLKAAEYPCGPGFGPNLRLARELLERGERSGVIEYLRLVSKSWESGCERIAEWIRSIEEGMMPDFGANLEY